VRSKRGLRVAYPLSAGAHEEYGGPLLLEDADADVVAARALAEARRLADAIRIYRLPAGGRIAAAVEVDRSPKHRTRIVCPVVGLSAFPGWDALSALARRFPEPSRSAAERMVVEVREVQAALMRVT